MATVPGAWITTLQNPITYTPAQLDLACRVAHILRRGCFVLVEPPRR